MSSSHEIIDMVKWIFLLLFFNVAKTQSSYLNCSIDTRYPLRFVGFFPCLNQWDGVGDCDRLTLTAVERAIAEINQDTNILRCFEIEMLPITVKDPVQNPTEIIELLYNEHNNLPIHGVIGPYHPESAKMFAYIFGRNLSTLQVSYSVTSILDNRERYPYFHTTIPNDEYFSDVISKLLDYFDWQKVAILSTNDDKSVLTSGLIYRKLSMKSNNSLATPFDSFSDSAEDILSAAKLGDFRIFIAIVESTKARGLLCEAYQAGLTTAKHVWILGGLTDPNWWRVDDNANGSTIHHDCTNDQMKEAINSMLFVDIASKLPFTDEKFDFLTQVFNKTNLTETEFNYSLLHSKVFNAYDAARILALTWNVTINNYTTEELHNLLNQSWKISNEERHNLVETLQYNLINNISPYTGLAGKYDFNDTQGILGSATITQFIGNGECVIGYYESANTSHILPLQHCHARCCCNATWKGNEECVIGYYESANASHILPLQHCHARCCCNATWKGNYLPYDRHCKNGSSCTCRRTLDGNIVSSFVVYSVVLIFGIIFSLIMQAVNYRWRNNKYFKGSSPPLNVLITFGCTVGYINGLLFLANNYMGMTGKGRITPMCYVTMISSWFSLTLISSTILLKNWRIFRIFHNRSQKMMRHLSNTSLFIRISLLHIPVIIILIVGFVRFPVVKNELKFPYQCPGFPENVDTSVIEDQCIEKIGARDGWNFYIIIYLFFIWTSIIVLGTINCHSISSHFSNEGELAYVVGMMSIFIFSIYYFILPDLHNVPKNLSIVNQMNHSFGVPFVYYTVILSVLYGSKAIWILRDKKSQPKLLREKTDLATKFNNLHEEILALRYQLEKDDKEFLISRSKSSSPI
ncbi:PREDICTED: gamma-aminobutyric acid type B receptor subunit 1-like isoform X2 [Amphimedon queenslandica]|uniref:G-protein coupled receptors family 3 profile domain-containing protein n=1 Tax=Amphimedon queenslandica TaxID=400682 RepID=A0AAN0JH02_AMPQE|nr:PREDICTED: gamma-aminobutyric acid type B receptor subunit 1-like isoform X2 [Amphimedon queenslandica]|eukprot:XP_019855938.1 PREDICTED: gamma-aminobutyric acid type B receptor subunit 1-like isoform X2 [Amphimedon queenslandica]